MVRFRSSSASLLVTLLLFQGCAPTASHMLTLPEETLTQRRLQTRHFDTPDEDRVLAACTALLQELGFQIDEGTSGLGMLSGSKLRDANPLKPEARVAAAALALASPWLLGLTLPLIFFVDSQPTRMEADILTRKVGSEQEQVAVRAIFKQDAPNGNASRTITDPKIYQDFFDRLSNALFLEARES
jgi:hypothetical protein